MSDARIEMVLEHLDPSPGRKLWHGGASALGALRGVSPEEAVWVPAPGRHSIWALTLHIAYWKYIVRRKIMAGPKGEFPRSPSNFPRVPEPASADSWKADRALLREKHRELVESIGHLDPARLDEIPEGNGSYSYRDPDARHPPSRHPSCRSDRHAEAALREWTRGWHTRLVGLRFDGLVLRVPSSAAERQRLLASFCSARSPTRTRHVRGRAPVASR